METRKGTVLFFSKHKGYGFVSSNGGNFFISLSNVKKESRLPIEGDTISFDFIANRGHYKIENIEVIK